MAELKAADETARGRAYVDLDGSSSRVLDECEALYVAEVAYVDAQIGLLLRELRDDGWLEEPLIVFTSDHGENLGEGGLYYEHGPSVSDASLRVPLIFAGPGLLAGVVDEGVARLEDILPTLLTLLNIPPSLVPDTDGEDLSRRLRSESAASTAVGSRKVFAESADALHSSMFKYLRSGRRGVRRCINGPRYSLCEAEHGEVGLYDHVDDPNLTRDLSSVHPEERRRLGAAAVRWPTSQSAHEHTVRTARFKLIEYPLLEGGYHRVLFDLRNDPKENRDISGEEPDVVRELARDLERWKKDLPDHAGVDFNADQLDALRALGYIE
jgi:arylsulfatase A-like enzyme